MSLLFASPPVSDVLNRIVRCLGQDMDPKLREFPYPLQTMLRHKRMDVLRTMLSGEVAGMLNCDTDVKL